MRVSKFITLVTFVTSFALLYVYQQSEIFRLAYVGQKQLSSCQDLLDRNSILRYNIKTNASLVQIGSKIQGGSDFQMPDSYRLVRLSPSEEGTALTKGAINRETVLSRLFGVKRQAEARTINP